MFVTGYSGNQTTGGYDYATVAYNTATGAQLWVKRYNGPGRRDFAHSMTVSGNTVFVTGSSIGTNDGYDYATVADNATTGAQLWAKRYNGAANGSRGANSVAASPDGKTVFVTGSSYAGSTTDYDYATIADNAATGAQLWVKRYTGPGSGDDQAYSVAVSPDGTTVFVTGYSSGTTAGQVDYATVGYNAATGAQLWVKRYAGLRGGTGTQAYSVAVSPDGARCTSPGKRHDSTMAPWLTPPPPVPNCGSSTTPATAPGQRCAGVAVSPTTGTVFVTGKVPGLARGNDDATIAYQRSTFSRRHTCAGDWTHWGYSSGGAVPVPCRADEIRAPVTSSLRTAGTSPRQRKETRLWQSSSTAGRSWDERQGGREQVDVARRLHRRSR